MATGPEHAHRAPMGDLPAPQAPPVPPYGHPDRGDQPVPATPVIVVEDPPAALMRRAAETLRGAAASFGRVALRDALEEYVVPVYTATAAVLDQAADRWDKETFGDDGGPAGPPWYHGVEATCGDVIAIVGDTCRCFNPMIHLARAVLGEVRP